MKNIIKRGTSLLLVLAMLLSFAAVVGAEEPTTTTPEKILTLTVENKLLRAGQTEYLAVYEEVAKGYKITGLTISATSTNSKVAVKGIYPWIPKSYSGGAWDYDYDTRETVFSSRSVGGDPIAAPPTADPLLVWTGTGSFQTSDKPLCFIAVEAQEDVTPGAYQINICRNPHPKKPDDHFLFAYRDPVTNKDLSQTEENAILNPGTAVVIPADATLPTVILTKTAFAAPTMAGLAAGGEAAGDYDLTKYVKLVTEEGLVDVTSLSVTVNGDKSVSLKQGNVLSLATTAEKDKGYKLTVTAANGKQLAAAVELPFTVSKNPVFTMAGFTKNNGYATAADIVGSKSVDAPLYGATNPKVISFDPRAFDQYGVPLSESQYTATTERHLYSDEDCTSNEITTGNAVESVTVSDGSLLISGNLQTDVWCKVRASATVNGETKYSDWYTFQIKSNYPQPRKAILSLTDGTNPVSNIIEIPTGETTKTITFSVDHFIDQFGHTMDNNTEPKSYTVNFKVPTTTPVPGVEGTSNGASGTITVKSTAASYAPITGTFEVLSEGTSIAAYLTDTITPATLTIKKADPIASSLASKKNDEDTFHDGEIYEKGSGTGNVTLTKLPGIGEKKTVELVPLYVLDQYDQPITNEYAQAANFQLYKVDGTTETKIDSDCVKFEKVGNTHVKLLLINKPGTDGKVVLKEGTYRIKAQWNGLAAQSASFTLTEADRVYTGVADFYGQSTIYVPYKHGTLDSTKTSSTVLGASLKDQYGELKTITSNAPKYTLSEIKLDGKEVTDNAVTVTNAAGYSDGRIEVKLSPDAAKYFESKEEIELTAAMTAEIDGETVSGIQVEITVKKDASKLAHLKVTGTASDGTTGFTKEVTILDGNVTENYNLIVPNTGSRTYTIALSEVEDQYGTALTDKVSRAVMTSGVTVENALKYDSSSKTLTVTPDAVGSKAVLTFTESGTTTGHKVELTLNFARMSFVNDKNEDYEVSMWLNTNPKDYAGQTWAELYSQIHGVGPQRVYIRGENNTLGDDVTNDVKVVIKQNGAEVFDSSKNYTEAPKANAGDYTIELIYVKQEGAEAKKTEYPIDSTPFQITPKEVTITVTGGTIRKEYDGTQSLVLPSGVTLTAGDIPMLVDPSALQYASENAGTGIKIELVPGKTTCLTSDAAANYNVNLYGLTGTITPRKLIVTPKTRTFTYGQDTEINAALEREYTVSNNLEGTKAATITGSMKLTTTSDADVTVYNAGTYNVVLGNLSLTGTSAGNYQLELASGTHTWTINRKLLTKVKNSGLPRSGFGANTDEGIIDSVWKGSVRVENGGAIEYVDVSDIVGSKDKLSFPADTKYFTTGSGATEKKYPMPGEGKTKTYTLVVTNPRTVEVGNNYYVNKDTVYEFQYDVLPINASSLIVTLTMADGAPYAATTYTYNGMEQGPRVQVTYEVKKSATETVTLDLTSISNISGARATNAATYTINVTAPTVATGTQTATWKINPKNINGEDIEVVLQALHYTGEYVDLCDAVVKLRDTTRGVDLEGVDWDFAGACGTTNAGESQNVRIDGKGNYDNYRVFPVTLQKAGAALDDTQLEGKQATRNKTNVIELSPKYKLAGNPTIEVVGSSEWLDNNSVSAEYKDGKIKITLNVKDGPVTETSKVKLKLTIAGTNNYAETVKEFDVKIIEKLVQNFTIAPATGDRAYSYSEGSVQMVATNAVGTVHWQIATDTSGGTAKIDSNGKLELGHPGTVKVVATANETDAYAAASQTYVLTITKGQVTITASSATMTANDPLPGFSATASGLNPKDSVSDVFQTLTASVSTDGKTAGTFRVTPNATFKTGGRKNWSECYDLYFVAGTLTVNPAQTAIDVVLPIIIGGNTCANGYANCACESFYDLDASRWYHEAIDWAYSLGLMNGTTKSTFGPNAAATRAQTWTMLARIAGQDTRRSSTWYEVGQKWAMNLGITDGTNPMGSLTREQLAAMLYRYVGSPAVNGTLTFTDSANVSAWARNAMIWAVQNGILDGVGGNRLNPKGTTTRAQAAAIFMRFSKLINK